VRGSVPAAWIEYRPLNGARTIRTSLKGNSFSFVLFPIVDWDEKAIISFDDVLYCRGGQPIQIFLKVVSSEMDRAESGIN